MVLVTVFRLGWLVVMVVSSGTLVMVVRAIALVLAFVLVITTDGCQVGCYGDGCQVSGCGNISSIDSAHTMVHTAERLMSVNISATHGYIFINLSIIKI